MSELSGSIFMIVAPSGAGKSSLVKALLENDSNIHLSISCTTRPPRPGETHGKEYYFINQSDFIQLKEKGELLEWAEVHSNFYGTPKAPLLEALKKGQDVLLEIDWQGAQKVRQHFSKIVDIFILPPSHTALRQRLSARGQDSDEVIERRLLAADSEIAHTHECEYVIINDKFEIALRELQQIISVARLRFAQQKARHSQLFKDFNI